ncbi:MAG: hypothetical protein LAO31_20470 [Acidobacteriia bacterium]|nr:hypothetical protein [Terriglobia bacterium]
MSLPSHYSVIFSFRRSTSWVYSVLAQSVAVVLLLSTGCHVSQTKRPRPISEGSVQSLRLELPPSLEHERSEYESEVLKGLDEVANFFRSSGFELPSQKLIESVLVFDSSSKGREYMVREYGAPLKSIPETFSGTVEGRRLLLVSHESYREIWRKLYSEWPWTDKTYHQLIVHELAHRAHEAISISRFGSADAMGPPWFFEGLAVVCAGQFETDQPPMSREEMEKQVGLGRTPKASYPLYGRIVRSLVAEFGMKTLIPKASEQGFPEILWSNQVMHKPGKK